MGLCLSSYIIPLCLLAVPSVQSRSRGFLDYEDDYGSGDEWEWSPSECEGLWASYYDRHIELTSAFTTAQSKSLSIFNEVHVDKCAHSRIFRSAVLIFLNFRLPWYRSVLIPTICIVAYIVL